jgi:hypothetical protein
MKQMPSLKRTFTDLLGTGSTYDVRDLDAFDSLSPPSMTLILGSVCPSSEVLVEVTVESFTEGW